MASLTYNIIVADEYKATVSLDIDANSNFTGKILSDEFGTGNITDGLLRGKQLNGIVTLEGYDASFNAVIDDPAISGSISYGWFFNKAFSGTLVA